jgi:hypothetical protein
VAEYVSTYSSAECANLFANTMIELAMRELLWMGEVNPSYRRTIFYIHSPVLISFFNVGAGDKKLHEEAESLRSHIIVNARGIWDYLTYNRGMIPGILIIAG